MNFILVNNFNTTLSAASSSTATTFTVSSSTNLPTLATGEVLPITLNDEATRQVFEICYVTGISGNVLTVERAQEGTSAQNWNVGDYIWNGPTAGTALLQNTVDPFTTSGLITANGGLTVPSGQTITIPNAAANSNPVALGQFLPYNGVISSANTSGTSLTLTTPIFTAPSKGYFLVLGSGVWTVGTITSTLSASLGALTYVGEAYSVPSISINGLLTVNSGQQTSFSLEITSTSSNAMELMLTTLFVPTA